MFDYQLTIKARAIFLSTLSIPLLAGSLFAESLFLKSGKILEGKISGNTKDITILLKDNSKATVKRDEILRIKEGAEYKREKVISLGAFESMEGFIVDEDESFYTIRRAIHSPEEFTLLKSRVKKIYEVPPAARLREEEIAKKKTGWYFTVIPFLSYNTENSLFLGGRVNFYQNGPRDGEFFEKSPYDLEVYLHMLYTLGGYQQHRLNLDKYHVMGSAFRIFTYFEFRYNINANYFGTGKKIISSHLTDANGMQYTTFKKYEDNFLYAGNMANAKYNKFEYVSPRYSFNTTAKFWRYFHFLAGFLASWFQINPWDGRDFEQDFKGYTANNDSLLTREKPLGFNGGWTNYIRLGLAFDTRDYPPDPNIGVYIDYTLEASGALLGSDYEYFRNTFGFRFYVPLFWKPLVLAARLGFSTSTSGIPFYEMGIFPYLLDRTDGLEGNAQLKGYKFARYVAPTMTAVNIELRLKMFEFIIKNQRFGFKLIAHLDAKNMYDFPEEFFTNHRPEYYKFSYGASLAIIWNLATVMRIGVGFSPEDWSINMIFGQAF